jgi:hypothetical protein
MTLPTRVCLGLSAGLAVAALTPVVANAADTETTFVTMVSETGDYIGGGGTRLWRAGSGSTSVSGSVEDGVTVHVSGGASGDAFDLRFAAAPGESLGVGTYDRAMRAPFRTDGRPGIDISGDGRGCNQISGRFTVLDLAPDLSRLWLVYEQHCEGQEQALFGEVRVAEPGGDSDLLVAPGTIAWPATYPDVAARTVPVRLVNTGVGPVTVSSATITSGTSDFSVASNGCAGLDVGSSCVINVGFTPSDTGARSGTLTILDSTPAGSHTVALAGSGIAGHTAWAMRSDPGDWIGAGEDWVYSPATATIVGSGNDSLVSLSADGWTATFEADSGHTLLPGTTFSGAVRYPFNDSSEPGLDVSGHGRGCNELTGTFTVHEAAFDEGGELERFSVSFEQHCEGGSPALRGSIAWKADNPAVALPPRLSVSTDRAKYAYGAKAAVRAKLSADSSQRSVSIYQTPRGGTRQLVTTADVDEQGRLSVEVSVKRTTTFTVELDGQGQVPDVTDSVTAKVSARVTPTMLRYRRRSAGSFVYRVSKTAWIKAKVSPDHSGDCVYFRAEFKVGHTWGYPSTTGCVTLAARSYALAYLKGTKDFLGIPIRLRAEWKGDQENAAARSPWQHVMFVR